MTIQNTTIRKAGPSQGNGVTTVFPFTFKVFTTADILVTYLDVSGVESVLVLTTNYTVSLNADQNTSPGGSVTLLVAPATGTYITLTSQVTNTQTLALTNSGGFYPESINNALDRTVIEIQQLAEHASRSITIPKSSTASPLMPIPAANNVLVWNNAATALINLPATTGTSLVNLAASTGSTLVGTKTSGTGAVTRTVASKLNDTVSVKDFGAIGDGVTNDTVAFTNAAAASKVIHVPLGTYLLNSAPTLGDSVFKIDPNVTYSGVGAATMLEQGDGGLQTMHYNAKSTDVATTYVRRVANFTGGTSGVVNSGIQVKTDISASVTSFEWGILSILNNSASAGEHVAGYFQANKNTSGGKTWGICVSNTEFSGTANPTTQTIGIEVDIFATGTDTNLKRVGIDIVGGPQSGTNAGIYAGLRIGPFNGINTSCTYTNGILLLGSHTNAITVSQSSGNVGININGTSSMGIDLSAGTFISGTAIRISASHQLAFDVGNLKALQYQTNGLAYQVSGVIKSKLLDNGGLILAGGTTEIQGTFSSGGTVPLLSANKPGGNQNIGTWLSVLINGGQYWLPVWAN